jgi:hypothetical protein
VLTELSPWRIWTTAWEFMWSSTYLKWIIHVQFKPSKTLNNSVTLTLQFPIDLAHMPLSTCWICLEISVSKVGICDGASAGCARRRTCCARRIAGFVSWKLLASCTRRAHAWQIRFVLILWKNLFWGISDLDSVCFLNKIYLKTKWDLVLF